MTQEIIPSDFQKFFEYGEVSLEEHDFFTRQTSIRICMPCSLFQAVIPSLLGAGVIDQFKIREPMAIWIPNFSQEMLLPMADQSIDNILIRINMSLKAHAEEILQTFHTCAQLITNPSSLIPILPLGVYITIRFRCRIDDIPNVLIGIQKTPVDGIYEFQWALATVLARILEDFEKRDSMKVLQFSSS